MYDEIRHLEARNSWVYVDPLPCSSGHNVVSSKWVFRMKRDARGEVTGYRARLVAQGFTQVEGIDYFSDDTFAAVCKLASVRVILSVAARNGWYTHQVDVKSAYLYGKLRDDEKIYMRPPPDIELDGIDAGQLLLLLVTIYGLKQSGRRWYIRLREILEGFKLVRLEHDHAVFYHRHPDGEISIIFLHVDDMTLVCSLLANLLHLKEMIKSKLEITDNGELHWLLGIEIRRNLEKHTIALSQRAYIESIIARYGFADAKQLSQPMDTHVHLSVDQCPVTTAEYAVMRDKPYLEALGALQYVSVATRPDITFTVGQLAQFSRNPGIMHWNALKHVYQYLKGTADLWLVLGGSEDNDVVGYSDADGMSTEGRRPVSGYVFMLNGGAVSWSSKRQDLVTLSTTEAEYVALTHASKEALWLRSFIIELFGNPEVPIPLRSDNQSAIALSKDDRFHARTKHIDIRFHFIHYAIADGKISLSYCPTEDMTADILTKALPSMKSKHFASSMGLTKV
ncbi:hypothetical protein SCP_0800760 [Sparassis crispa]|uniref:Reverse transcriptase Ty1/copia-type domain-containing protein n=1 Tax=Sparassis crispa TaxID=139825 RepID=A0A401GTP5_9APHY|nr:hypothetical protein SCP_0800760 [Sparassis crispa]GBE85559.1 hypothetical protein SCP_0800760 [Sparassis crispa]